MTGVDVPTIEPTAGWGPLDATLDADRARRFALATNDENRSYREGGPVPPVFVVVPIFELVHRAMREAVPREVMAAARAAVHGEHDIVFHRPALIGSKVHSRADLSGVQTSASGTRVTVRLVTYDTDDRLVVEQFWTTFLQGSEVAGSWGHPGPDHSFPEAARAHPVAEVVARIDEDMPLRYADASGDHSPHHVDLEAARREGFPDLLVHGLSVMALSGRAVVDTVAGGDPRRLRRLAVRFAAPTLPGTDLTVRIYDAGTTPAGRRAYAFEAAARESLAIKNGWAELD
jgi:acyl dehydratase